MDLQCSNFIPFTSSRGFIGRCLTCCCRWRLFASEMRLCQITRRRVDLLCLPFGLWSAAAAGPSPFRRFSVVPPSILSFLSDCNASSVFPGFHQCHSNGHDYFFLKSTLNRVDCCISLNLRCSIAEMIPFISREGKPVKYLTLLIFIVFNFCLISWHSSITTTCLQCWFQPCDFGSQETSQPLAFLKKTNFLNVLYPLILNLFSSNSSHIYQFAFSTVFFK